MSDVSGMSPSDVKALKQAYDNGESPLSVRKGTNASSPGGPLTTPNNNAKKRKDDDDIMASLLLIHKARPP